MRVTHPLLLRRLATRIDLERQVIQRPNRVGLDTRQDLEGHNGRLGQSGRHQARSNCMVQQSAVKMGNSVGSMDSHVYFASLFSARPSMDLTFTSNSMSEKGLVKTASASFTNSGAARTSAVTTAILLPVFSRSTRKTSQPSTPGRCRSNRTRSGL